MINLEATQNYLDQALESIFKPTDQGGFWNVNDNRIIKRIVYQNEIPAIIDDTIEWRYAPFCLMGILYWRYTNPKSHGQYDEKIKNYLNFIKNNFPITSNKNKEIGGFEFGLLLSSFTLSYLTFQIESHLQYSMELFQVIRSKFAKINDNQASFILFGMTWLYEILAKKKNGLAVEIYNEIKTYTDYFIQRQDSSGVFHTGDQKFYYHQRICYLLWALARSSHILKDAQSKLAIEKTLDMLINERALEDFAFKWHASYRLINLKIMTLKMPVRKTWGNNLLFSCHQAFFAVACMLYVKIEGARDYRAVAFKALEWIWGKNRKNCNLVTYTGKNIPWRLMDFNGNLTVSGQNFIGTYEVGAYIMALSDLVIIH